MAASARTNPIDRFQERLVQRWRRWFAPGDLTALIVSFMLLLMPALALQAADWPLAMDTILPVLALSVGFGFLLARSHYHDLVAIVVNLVYGLAFILLVAAINEPGGLVSGMESVLGRSIIWVYDAATGGINQDPLVFTLLVAGLFWYLGYNTVWHTFRYNYVWRVILPPGLMLIINMVVYNGDSNLDLYAGGFIFMALLLIVHSNLDAREWHWYVSGIRMPRGLRRQFTLTGAMLALAAMLLAYAVPSSDLQERLDRFQQFLQSDPVLQLSELWNRLVAPIEAEGPATSDYYGSDALDLGGAIQLGDQTVLLIDVPNDGSRYYWRSRVFERYESGGWAHSAETRYTTAGAPVELSMSPEVIGAARRRVDQTVTIGMSGTRLLYAAPQPSRFDVHGRIDLRYTDPPQNESMNVSVVRPVRVLERGASYQASSLMSTASAYDLRAAAGSYPEWVRNPNLYISPSVSPRVLQLGRQIVQDAGATTPYDQARAIESWLRQNITYNERIPEPPEGVDPIEWLLFDQQEGYCTYYATAMILMLRGLDVPARMAAGFSQGQWDAELGQFVVRERDAHTWVEVYFPGYGWVEFEPTSAQAPIERDGDEPAQPQQQPVVPQASPTATATPTPLPSPTPQADIQQDSLDDEQPPTVTSTPSPTPTATPVIVPTVAPPIEPRNSDFLSFLLPAVGLAVLILLSIVLLVLLLVFVWWWWEWRGMGGLSPVARAYARLERYIGLLGLRLRDDETPEERRRSIVRKLPDAERPVTAITRTYMSERYGDQSKNSDQRPRNARIADNAWLDARGKVIRRWLRRFMFWKRD